MTNYEKMKKIYVLTCGEYSDYAICAVTLSRSKAHELLREHPNWRIEEYNDAEECKMPVYQVTVYNSGEPMVLLADKYTDTESVECLNFGRGWYTCFVCADDEEHAKKIALDRIAEYKAKMAGIV